MNLSRRSLKNKIHLSYIDDKHGYAVLRTLCGMEGLNIDVDEYKKKCISIKCDNKMCKTCLLKFNLKSGD